MNKYARKGFLLRIKHNEYKLRLNKSKRIIKQALDKNNCYVSFSGGKDSTVLTHLALSIDENIPVWHWDYGDDLMPRDIEKEVISNLKELGAKNIIVNKRKGDGANTHSGYKQFFNQIKINKQKYNWDMGLIGIRREESITRKNKYTSYFMEGNCYPLLDWSYEDIWAYIVSECLPYPHVYDLYSSVTGWDKSRFVTFFDPEFETLNGRLDGIIIPEYRNR